MQEKFRKIRDALAQRKKRLIHRFIDGQESDFQFAHAGIIDNYFCEIFEKSAVGPRMEIDKHPYVIVAQGGYGRREQCLHSDIDLLFLFKDKIGQGAEELIREIIYPLWDIGLEVGYATRSMKDCIRLAGDDYEILTALLDARFVCGMSPLYLDLKEQLHKKIIRRKAGKIVEWYIEGGRNRHQHFGDSTNLLEPNLKEGRGGLRDYHALLWIAHINHHIDQPRDLERYGYLSHYEFEKLSRALMFIWNVRNHLHYLSGRKNDRLYFDSQEKLAERIDFDPIKGLQPVECFMGTLHGHMAFIKQCYQIVVHETEAAKQKKKPNFPETSVIGLRVVKEALTFDSSESVLQNPELLANIFEESLRLQIPISTEAMRLIREFSYLVDAHLSASPAAVKSFDRVLGSPAADFDGLDDMLHSGFLENFIPEIKTIRNRIEFDSYHIYPVGRHSLKTVRTLQSFVDADSPHDPLYGMLLDEIENKRLLYWTALLHDIGKGNPEKDHAVGGAELAAHILSGKGFSEHEINSVTFLIERHLLLKQIATRRDIQDEETAVSCAREIEDIHLLKMLYLLTVADAMSTGPMAWNDWSEALLKDFFLKVLRILEKGELASHAAVADAEAKKNQVIGADDDPEQRIWRESLYGMMSPRYILDTSAEDMLDHMDLYRRLAQNELVWDITRPDRTNTRTVTICAKDRPGLFSKIAGVFTLNQIRVLSAQIYTWRNNVALDIFKVEPPPDQIFENECWKHTDKTMKAVLSGTMDLGSAIRKKLPAAGKTNSNRSDEPATVIVDNESSSFFTIIELFADEIPGLLFAVADEILNLGLDIWVAKIAAKVDQIVYVFYVRDFDGQKVDQPEQVAGIKQVLEHVSQGYSEARTVTGTYS